MHPIYTWLQLPRIQRKPRLLTRGKMYRRKLYLHQQYPLQLNLFSDTRDAFGRDIWITIQDSSMENELVEELEER